MLCPQELNLSFGEITEAAALVVAQAVMDKPHMEKVDLNGEDADVAADFSFPLKSYCFIVEGIEMFKDKLNSLH